MSTELWAVLGTTIVTFAVVVVPGVAYAWVVLDSWADDD